MFMRWCICDVYGMVQLQEWDYAMPCSFSDLRKNVLYHKTASEGLTQATSRQGSDWQVSR
jgi:hypothetical protein